MQLRAQEENLALASQSCGLFPTVHFDVTYQKNYSFHIQDYETGYILPEQ